MRQTVDGMRPTRIMRMCFAVVLSITFSSCMHNDKVAFAQGTTGGDSQRGQQLIYSYNCGSCHIIPGIAEANGTVGPPLRGFGNRIYISGSLLNSPENLFRWIREPQQVEDRTAMPNLGVTKEQAIDIAAYLYTLQ